MLLNLKYYFFILLWIVYLSFYFSYKVEILNIFSWNIYWKTSFSVFSAFVAVFTSFTIFSLILKSTKNFAETLYQRRDSKIYPILSGMFLKFLSYANYIVSLYLGFSLLIIPKEYNGVINKIVSTIFIFIALLVLSNIIITIFEKRWVFQFRFANKLSIHLSSIIKKILLVFLWLIGWITVISNLGYDVSALIAWAWIWGLALALWAQKSLTNVFGAITIVLNKPFRIWDFVKIENTIWTVKDIWISYLTIVDKSGHQVMIPNDLIMSSFVENYSVRENRRVDFVLGLIYSTSEKKIEKAVEIAENILEIYEKDKKIAKFRVNFDNFWEYSLDIKITYFSLMDDYSKFLKEKENINLKIKKAFKKEKINIAFPTRNILIKKEK